MDIRDSFYKELFYEAPLGMVLLDESGQIIQTNTIFKRMCVEEKSQLFNTYFKNIIYTEDIWKWENAFKLIKETKNNLIRKEVRFLNPSGFMDWWRIDLKSFRENEKIYILALVEDITYIKRNSEKLTMARDQAEKATKTKSGFLANMSHEIRTPIHTILGMSDLLNETSLDEEQKEYARQVRFSADVLLNLVNDILDFSKIEAGKMTLEETSFDLYRLLEETVDLLTLEAHRKGIEIGIFLKGKIARLVSGDPVRLRQIIINLFNNAIKFTEKGQVVIVIKQLKESENSATLSFQIQDSGIGIPESKLKNLFKSFSQIDSSTTRKFGGTGLGLSISRNLVHLMGGEISVSSTEGKGSEFSFILSLKKQQIPHVYPGAETLHLKKLKILLVDDNPVIRGHIKEMLEDWNCIVEETDAGKTALNKILTAEKNHTLYDFCLFDQLMPGMDGWHLASEIHTNKNLKTMKLAMMIMTGKGIEDSKMKLLGWVHYYLAKPVKRNELLELITKVSTKGEDNEEVSELIELESTPSIENIKPSIIHNILVAEDHPVNQRLFQTILEKMGYSVLVADNGLQAVEKSNKVDLIFMDVQMPEMNGYEASSKIRETNTTIPIVAVTASAIKGERQKCIDVGMSDFLTKPFRKEDLVPVLKRWENKMELEKKDNTITSANEEVEIKPQIQLKEDPGTGFLKKVCEARKKLIFNYEEAVEVFMGNSEVVISLLKPFSEKVDGQLKEIEEKIAQEEFDSISELAHSIKGSSWNLKANELGDVAKTIETAAREKDILIINANFPELKKAYKNFSETIKKYI